MFQMVIFVVFVCVCRVVHEEYSIFVTPRYVHTKILLALPPRGRGESPRQGPNSKTFTVFNCVRSNRISFLCVYKSGRSQVDF